MTIKEKEQELWTSLRKLLNVFVEDGVVDEEKYLSSPIKILYILKEPNDGGNTEEDKKWSLSEFIYDGARSQTWDNVARWTEGIFNLDKHLRWSDLIQNDTERRQHFLKYVCAINIKKSGGGYVVNSNEVTETANFCKSITMEQIELYNANVIICCGKEVNEFMMTNYSHNIRTTSNGINYMYDENHNRLIIFYVHPEARISDNLMYYPLIDGIKEMMAIHEITFQR